MSTRTIRRRGRHDINVRDRAYNGSGLDDTLGVLDENWPELARQVRQRMREIDAEAYLPPDGALTDQVAKGIDVDAIGQVQVLSSQAPREKTASLSRRKLLLNGLGAALAATATGAAGAALITPWQQSRQEASSDNILSSALVEQIIDAYESRDAMTTIVQKSEAAGRFNEAKLASACLDHGSSYIKTAANLARLRSFAAHNSHDETTKAFVIHKYAVDHRYLGLVDQCDRFGSRLTLKGISNKRLLSLLLQIHHSRSRASGLTANADHAGLKRAIRAHQASVQSHLGFDPANPEVDDINDVLRTISCEAASHYTHQAQLNVFRSTSQRDAIERFEQLNQILKVIRNYAREEKSTYAFGESWWPYGSISLFAIYKSWHKLGELCVSLALENDAGQNDVSDFIERQKKAHASPAFTTFCLADSIRSQLLDGNGLERLNEWLPTKRRREVRHYGLSRGMIAFSRICGAPPSKDDPSFSLARLEGSDLLFGCLRSLAQSPRQPSR